MKTVTIPANNILFFIGAFLLTISVEGLHPTKTKTSNSRRSTVLDGCKDSPFPFKVVGRKGFRDCNWVASRPDKRCPIDGVSLMCAKTCDECLQLEESHLKFKFFTKNNVLRRKTCSFVAKKKTNRCEIPGMRDTCRVTCNDFTPITPSPTELPTPSYDYVEVFSGEDCETSGYESIYSVVECEIAAAAIGRTVTWGPHGGYLDVVDGCSARFSYSDTNLFFNTYGVCDPNAAVDHWTYTGCKCADWMPCLCRVP